MQAVPPSDVLRWMGKGGRHRPMVIGRRCGHCNLFATFHANLDDPFEQWKVSGAPIHTPCPACQQTSRWWLAEEPHKVNRGWLWVMPAAEAHELLRVEWLNWPPGLEAAYVDAVGALDAHLWPAAASQARRALEGIVKLLLGEDAPDGRIPLAALLEQLATEHREMLARPVTEAADLLREGGNVAAHFDFDEPPPDETLARGMIDLLEDLIEYLFVLPNNVRQLGDRMIDAAQQAEEEGA